MKGNGVHDKIISFHFPEDDFDSIAAFFATVLPAKD